MLPVLNVSLLCLWCRWCGRCRGNPHWKWSTLLLPKLPFNPKYWASWYQRNCSASTRDRELFLLLRVVILELFPSDALEAPNLLWLDVDDNDMHGTIENNIVNSNLQRFAIGKKQFTGTIPESLCDLKNAEYIDLGGNLLSLEPFQFHCPTLWVCRTFLIIPTIATFDWTSDEVVRGLVADQIIVHRGYKLDKDWMVTMRFWLDSKV